VFNYKYKVVAVAELLKKRRLRLRRKNFQPFITTMIRKNFALTASHFELKASIYFLSSRLCGEKTSSPSLQQLSARILPLPPATLN
jgi:hypothetical protein